MNTKGKISVERQYFNIVIAGYRFTIVLLNATSVQEQAIY